MAIKQATASIEKFVKGVWEKGLTGPADVEIVFTEQYQPPTELSNEFEARRNELERAIAPNRLQTLHLFYAPTKENLNSLLTKGFFQTIGVSKIAFAKDPIQAIKEGFGNTNKLLIVRVALGRENRDYNVVRGKYVVENLKSVITSYIITYAKPGESVNVEPTNVFPDRPGVVFRQEPEEDLIFHEATVVRYAHDDPNAVDVFGNQSHALTTEEERILKHIVKKEDLPPH